MGIVVVDTGRKGRRLQDSVRSVWPRGDPHARVVELPLWLWGRQVGEHFEHLYLEEGRPTSLISMPLVARFFFLRPFEDCGTHRFIVPSIHLSCSEAVSWGGFLENTVSSVVRVVNS